MPYIKLPNFKMGINPSLRSKLNPLALTGSQKIMLASSRIFGTNISGNLRSGNQELQKKFSPEKELAEFNTYAHDLASGFPWVQYYEQKERNKMMIELRKMRILMRGIKIGKKKGGGKVTLMDVFETKADDDF
ncbi:hypothetical protein ABPG74_006293 [Tetrahymena malaccensis]